MEFIEVYHGFNMYKVNDNLYVAENSFERIETDSEHELYSQVTLYGYTNR